MVIFMAKKDMKALSTVTSKKEAGGK